MICCFPYTTVLQCNDSAVIFHTGSYFHHSLVFSLLLMLTLVFLILSTFHSAIAMNIRLMVFFLNVVMFCKNSSFSPIMSYFLLQSFALSSHSSRIYVFPFFFLFALSAFYVCQYATISGVPSFLNTNITSTRISINSNIKY